MFPRRTGCGRRRRPREHAAAATAGQPPAGAPAPAVSAQRALLDQYCVTCHNSAFVDGTDEPRSRLVSQLRAVGLALDSVDVDNVAEDPEIWEAVVRKLRVGAMPPQPRPRPDKVTYDGFRRWLEDELDGAAEAKPNPGRTLAFHRLNQTEYRKVIRDLLDLDIDVRSGFPRRAGSVRLRQQRRRPVLSPSLLTLRVAAPQDQPARHRRAAGRGGVIATHEIPLNLVQGEQCRARTAFGSRGGAAVRHPFPRRRR